MARSQGRPSRSNGASVEVKDIGLQLVSCWYWLVIIIGNAGSELVALRPRVTLVPNGETDCYRLP